MLMLDNDRGAVAQAAAEHNRRKLLGAS